MRWVDREEALRALENRDYSKAIYPGHPDYESANYELFIVHNYDELCSKRLTNNEHKYQGNTSR